jgi:hypothetical protein
MVSIFYGEVLSLAEKLTPEERASLIRHLQEQSRKRKLSAAEFSAWLESISIDVGPLSEDWSDRREDWYGDDGR